MPQMMPINWIFMVIFSICIFILFIIMNYYNFFYQLKKNQNIKNFKSTNFNWKW